MSLEQAEVNSTNSFVDIIANTTGMIIKLTLLAMLLGHQQSRRIDVQLQRLDDAKLDARKLRAELDEQPARLAAAQQQTEQGRLRLERAEGEAERLQARIRETLLRIQVQEADQAELARAAVQGAQVLEQRRLKADEDATRLLAGLDPVARELVVLDDAALAARETALRERLAALQKRLGVLQGQATTAGPALDATESAGQDRLRELQAKRSELVREIDVHRLASQRPYGSKPFLAEVYRDAGGVARFRRATAAYFRSEGTELRPLKDGPAVTDLAEHPDLAQPDGIGAEQKHYLLVQVRNDAFSGFRLARAAAEARGWWVEWDPIDVGRPMTIGSRQPESQP